VVAQSSRRRVARSDRPCAFHYCREETDPEWWMTWNKGKARVNRDNVTGGSHQGTLMAKWDSGKIWQLGEGPCERWDSKWDPFDGGGGGIRCVATIRRSAPALKRARNPARAIFRR